MRVHELLDEVMGVKKFANMTFDEVLDYVNQHTGPGKFQVLGHGNSAVALKKGNVCYKFWFKDDAYEKFVKYCLEHQDNPFLPKFYGGIKTLPAFFLRSKNAPDRISYIKMELLEEDEWFEFRAFENGKRSGTIPFEEVLQAVCDSEGETLKKRIKDVRQGLEDYDGKPGKEPTEELIALVKTIEELEKIHPFLDLHEGNALIRDGRQLVIIDPFYTENDKNLTAAFVDATRENGKSGIVRKK